MVSTPEVCYDNIIMTPNQYESMKIPSARKPLRKFSEILDVKNKTDVCRLCEAKSKCKEIRTGNTLWSNI